MNDTTTPSTPTDDQAARTLLSQQIADQLGETESEPKYIIRLALLLIGHARILALVEETLAIESNGGMMTNDGKRRRTPGGVFFSLLRKACTKEQHAQLFPPDEKQKRAYMKRKAKKAKGETR